MKTSDLKEMERLLDLKFQKKQRSYVKVLEQEAGLRGKLKKLDAQVAEAEKSNGHNIQAVGADVIWKAWVERSKRKLNLELAQTLALKESLKGAVQKEYGKLLVSSELLANHRAARADVQKKEMLERSVDGHIQRTIWFKKK